MRQTAPTVPTQDSSKKQIKFSIKKKFVVLAFLVAVLMNVGMFVVFRLARNDIIQGEITRAGKDLETLSVEIFERLGSFEHDLIVLTNTSSLKSLIQDTSSNLGAVGQSFDNHRDNLQDLFISFSGSKPWYMQIRYIDEFGQEIIRVDRRSEEEGVIIVPQEELQNKKNRYYFQDTVKLAPGSIYVSELDLNIEAGEIERPFKPTIRYATPVFDSSGKNRGILIINVLAQNLLDFIKQNYPEVIVVDEMNYFLINNNNPDQEWGKSLGNDYKFEELEKHDFIMPELTHHDKYSHLDEDEQRLEIFRKVNYNKTALQKFWVLSRVVSFEDLFTQASLFQKETLLVQIGIFIVFVMIFTVFILDTTRNLS